MQRLRKWAAKFSPTVRSCLLPSNSSLFLEKIVPDLVQLSDCLLEREDRGAPFLVVREAKVIECFKRGGDVEMNFCFKAFREPADIPLCV